LVKITKILGTDGLDDFLNKYNVALNEDIEQTIT